ncbi:FmdB family transcriptional regulator [Phytoactinopolyspora alkaliphila]|uniref:FmdB family transcriptional regulator n=1 Tax=Phytoactinopolyspora alkaliphila TaxID=1783498 RepID=A0A6N9YIF3_9ACTN|nr:FmdB family transcriptional regulator [Phytoactinopolyspora alkaliphila]
MPTYQYTCTDCGEPLEVVQSFSDDALTECPSCQGRLRKVFSAVGVVFKGSGFYRTDSRSSESKNGSSTSTKPAESTSSSESSSSSSSGSSDSSSSSSGGSSESSSSSSSNGSSSSSSKTPAPSAA